ncbi:MAG: hypothetical protein CMA63_07025 [Euryarchaeota archaeon]|nr:hypothetical protein [Euryarchaeota archaeon]|tara:strand:- start:25946 stop:26392 length:447 start_codon:yes stop_codon:yes gene_type:complete
MAKKKKQAVELPTWAKPLWEEMGSPDLSDFIDIYNGDLLKRRHGLRKDDFVEVLLDSRSMVNTEEAWMRGRLLSSGKSSIELLCEDGRIIFLARDIIAQIVLVAHTRPAYIDDKDLLAFERADMKRRSNLHEKVEKESKGSDDSHLWG